MGAPLSYKILMIQMVSDEDKKEIQRAIVKCTTPTLAKALVLASMWKYKPGQIGYRAWAYTEISLLKDYSCGLLSYKNLATALYFKRQTSTIVPEPCDPVPEGTLENEDDVWAMLDLFSKSTRQLHGELKGQFVENDIELADLKMQLDAKSILLEAAQGQIKSLNTQLKALQPKRKGRNNDKSKNGSRGNS